MRIHYNRREFVKVSAVALAGIAVPFSPTAFGSEKTESHITTRDVRLVTPSARVTMR